MYHVADGVELDRVTNLKILKAVLHGPHTGLANLVEPLLAMPYNIDYPVVFAHLYTP